MGRRSKSKPLTSFHKFPLLPIELQLMIWNLCLPRRSIEVYDESQLCFRKAGCHPPLISQVCRTSRNEALLGAGWKPWGFCEQLIWFDEKTDTIKLPAIYVPRYGYYSINEDSLGGPGPELYRVLSTEETPILINLRCLVNRAGYKAFTPYDNSYEHDDFGGDLLPIYSPPFEQLAWMICQRPQKRSLSIRDITLRLTHQAACECGLFGLFAEQNPTHLSLFDKNMMRRLDKTIHKHMPSSQQKKYNSIRIKATNISEALMWYAGKRQLDSLTAILPEGEIRLPRYKSGTKKCLEWTRVMERRFNINFVISIFLIIDEKSAGTLIGRSPTFPNPSLEPLN
ncbi:hypothetical protein F5B22DRAFT_654615 [Xylaria bambusicola]|uniref:uncharacterized protein n=1 Tax=Xylaria bambusicola TaxID=326684 RepID=UPI00200820A9|nr:uncharacterized protein F5B22DRAFT_654615 [Xylaria bambusicola]KAI0517864.1 hypothetical protein F5B22DRAFT_654615 [Xylaria bambusicola]